MKPLGPIPAGFAVIDGELAIAGLTASTIVEQAGQTPLFVYSADMLRARMAALRAAMPEQLHIHYAMKANPFAPLLRLMGQLVDGFDIASGGELAMAINAGLDPARISFAGPGKRDGELEQAIVHGVTLNCESPAEIRRSLAIADRVGRVPQLAIRVNPSFELRGSGMKMGGGAKPFGMDEALVVDAARLIIDSGAQWRGLHIFTGSQALDAAAIVETQDNVLTLAARLTAEIGVPLPHLNMGGGMGIPYFHGDQPLDPAAVGRPLADRLESLPPELAGTDFAMELGRYLVGEAGVYLTQIIDRKESHGQVFLITDGGLHHQLAASGNFGTVVRRNYPVAIASRYGAPAEEDANVVGCLCTPLDRLADQAALPRADVGDLVVVFCAGAYGASASPSAFLGQGAAAEILI
ncbi:pyridoxal-dependent decarboxylase, exosortase A system-associated [Altererythrobacter xixiisoli]|uniref:Pyridoxal-dependent decarboxylase, exosortase A system-associated n=1 Tax=Croceibacterium xixiisoli TaxID=1476466 RepID=A0A6I4TZ01_9SPHN|nr:pyridoxal-dependent decarboxylase, exosortase A system-associated [Croceibacterium xixiisoli]MXO99858.1 pyridoxal-dependent decarboxylase, exosortase A system-associated [Croceibacterium xixiisoli]